MICQYQFFALYLLNIVVQREKKKYMNLHIDKKERFK